MKYIKKFNTANDYNHFMFNYKNTPNVSLVTELSGSDRLSFKPQSHDYSKDYLTIVAIEDLTVFLTYHGMKRGGNNVSYSINNGNTWQEMKNTVSLNAGDKIMFKHSGVHNEASTGTFFFSDMYNSYDPIPGKFNVEGNVMSLIYGDNFIGQTSFPEGQDWEYIFYSLFSSESNLISAANLILPALILPDACYFGMFTSCTSLTTAPELPATTLSHGCYNNMFTACPSLTNIFELPAKILEENCYAYMFGDCSSLTYIKCLAKYFKDEAGNIVSLDNVGNNATRSWLDGANVSGVFIKDKNINSWPTGDDGIPSGWTVQDA